MKLFNKIILILMLPSLLTGCLVTSVVGGAVSAVKTTVSTAVDVVDTVTPDIID
ncbi:hypothetical protein EDC46_1384 [Vespertiliibacter pulmonis]|uniref:Lipoprotein n=1 Tax=Vespertiliibacter pulmonis TaxID=1443036 RepID=A0A3N4VM04_9PAST|nr:hypothetical protein [Vespertiliibacter pulmonis]RPE82713.1 hypothetical protein EDC46_1384 [Vespertiliibacter pulmonis]